MLNSLLRASEIVVDSVALNMKIQKEGCSRVGKGNLFLGKETGLAEQEDWSGGVEG